jgi:hypothetical protein
MTRLNANDARCEALFASALQRSDALTPEALAEAISRTVQQLGIGGCAGRMAQEFGDHPDTARDRMRWIRQLVSEVSGSPARPPGPSGAPPDAEGRELRGILPDAGGCRRAHVPDERSPRWQVICSHCRAGHDSIAACCPGSRSSRPRRHRLLRKRLAPRLAGGSNGAGAEDEDMYAPPWSRCRL